MIRQLFAISGIVLGLLSASAQAGETRSLTCHLQGQSDDLSFLEYTFEYGITGEVETVMRKSEYAVRGVTTVEDVTADYWRLDGEKKIRIGSPLMLLPVREAGHGYSRFLIVEYFMAADGQMKLHSYVETSDECTASFETANCGF